MNPIASIIIPTCANAARTPFLRRAIRSVLSNQDGLALPVVAVNGSGYLPEVLDELRRRRDIRCLYLEEAGTTGARLAARKVIDTQFFGILDDDDEYLPGGIEAQSKPMLLDSTIDAVVTNGYRRDNGTDTLHFAGFSTFHRDPLNSLMEWAWLTSGGLLCRTAAVPASYLDVPRSMELTYMALKLALTKKLRFVDTPTYLWHRDAPEQLSRSKHYTEGAPSGIGRMMELNPPPRIKRSLARKHAAALHFLSDWERADGNYRAAWRYHLRSLLSLYGIKYLPYTRHLVRYSRFPRRTSPLAELH